jgi:hypothetical protein
MLTLLLKLIEIGISDRPDNRAIRTSPRESERFAKLNLLFQ